MATYQNTSDLIQAITDSVQDYINEYHEIDDLLVIERTDNGITLDIVSEDAELNDTADAYSFPDFICFDAEGNQVPDAEVIEEMVKELEL